MNKIRYNFYKKGLEAGFSHEQLNFLWEALQESLHTQVVEGLEKASLPLTETKTMDVVEKIWDQEHKDFLNAVKRLFGDRKLGNKKYSELEYLESFYKKEVLDMFMAIIDLSEKYNITVDHITLPKKYKPDGYDFPEGTKIFDIYVR